MEQKNEPKNTFREEVKKDKADDNELIRRDAYIEYLHRKVRRELAEATCEHLQAAIEKLNDHANRIFQLPNSPARDYFLQIDKDHIAQLEKQKEVSKPNRASLVILAVLEELFEKDKDGEEKNHTADKNV